ncbi:MAG: hypothetical protein WCD89_19285 [Anaerocolumna sp.]
MENRKEVIAPLFRDPIYDGASDPVIITNRDENCFYMFYTQRRFTSVQIGFSSIHGSAIGVASSVDGEKWLYRGILSGLDIEPDITLFGHRKLYMVMENTICMFLLAFPSLRSDGLRKNIHMISRKWG